MLRWFAPWLICLMVAVKLGLGTWAMHACRKCQLLSVAQMSVALAVFLALAALALGSVLYFLPREGSSIVKLICTALLIPPFARCIAAVPALHANRHR